MAMRPLECVRLRMERGVLANDYQTSQLSTDPVVPANGSWAGPEEVFSSVITFGFMLV